MFKNYKILIRIYWIYKINLDLKGFYCLGFIKYIKIKINKNKKIISTETNHTNQIKIINIHT
jgi:hypothetical protein